MNMFATQVIDTLGGTAAVSRLFGIALSSVSNWRDHGIPKPRMMYLEVAKKKQLQGIDLKAATAPQKRSLTPKQKEVAHG